MKSRSRLVSPISFLSAGLLYTLLVGWGTAASFVVPPLLELLHSSPRLAMIGFLALAISPGVVVAVVHRFGHGVLDAFDSGRSTPPAASSAITSASAGAHALLVFYGTTMLANLVYLVLHPPKLEPETFAAVFVGVTSAMQTMSVHTLIWVLIAATFFELERRTRRT